MPLGTSDLIEFLSKPSSYPHKTDQNIQVIQTQMSLVFLTGDCVYKVHKPVDLGYVDYTTLDKRHYFCEQEVILNKRLSPELYYGVVPITMNAAGSLELDGKGEIIEYAVKMKTLPADKMLDKLLVTDSVTPDMMINVAKKVSAFHKKAVYSEEIAKVASLDTLTFNADENFQQLSPYIGRVFSQQEYDRICIFTRNFLKDNAGLFNKRISDNRIKDCHGDLHSQHICFTDPISIYDCIEFTDRFRYVDVAAEVAFLCMDLDHSGHSDLAQTFLAAYVEDSQDEEILKLSRYYRCYYACVRAKVNCFQLDDPLVSDEAKAKCQKTAKSYVDLACSYTDNKTHLFINYGTTGCGKSTLSRELSQHLGLIYISSDITRKRLANVALDDHHFKELNADLYSPEMTKKTYDTLYENADKALRSGMSVIIDAAFLKKEERAKAFDIAKKNGAKYHILEYPTTKEDTIRNLQKRSQENDASDGTFDIYLMQIATLDQLTDDEKAYAIVIDQSGSLDNKINKVMEVIANE
jgi:aminoglycoside phosphotransferase family enzyme/gluconate kinase